MKRLFVLIVITGSFIFYPSSRHIQANDEPRVQSLALSSDGSMLALSTNELLKVYQVTDANVTLLWSYDGSAGFYKLRFSPTNQWLVAGIGEFGDSYGDVIVFDSHTGHEISRFNADTSGITALAFSPDERYLAVGGGNFYTRISFIRAWDTATWEKLPQPDIRITDQPYSIAISPSNQYLVYLDSFSGKDVYDFNTGELLARTHDLNSDKVMFIDNTHFVLYDNQQYFIDEWEIHATPEYYLTRLFHGGPYQYEDQPFSRVTPSPEEISTYFISSVNSPFQAIIFDSSTLETRCRIDLKERNLRYPEVLSDDKRLLAFVTEISQGDTAIENYIPDYQVWIIALDTCLPISIIDVS